MEDDPCPRKLKLEPQRRDDVKGAQTAIEYDGNGLVHMATQSDIYRKGNFYSIRCGASVCAGVCRSTGLRFAAGATARRV